MPPVPSALQHLPLEDGAVVAAGRDEELVVGRIAMLGIAGMVAQELNTAGYLFYPDTY